MKKILFSGLVLLAASLTYSCSVKEEPVQEAEVAVVQTPKVIGEPLPQSELLPLINVKVSEEMAARLESATDEHGFVKLPEVRSFSGIGIVRMRRLFPYAGKFEARTRAEGLHLWYEARYDASQIMTRAASGLAIPGVEIIEYCPRMEIIGNPEIVPVAQTPATRAGGSSLPFDDPRLPEQWHYYNNGSAPSSVSGCDINVVPVWRKYTTGSDAVIVGVVDGGIDYNHEDLKANMWHNPEKTGENVYGKNFTDGSFIIRPEMHGTHVAGTIAAVNNNGIGVCGVAGGNAKTGVKGARLMSCQIFDGENQGSGAEAIKWSADHGAVISQNSWGYIGATSTPSSLIAAVDYFTKYAGIDESGKQTGPMRGGIVIFASGNENATVSGNEYEGILNVTALAADYKRSYFTNYGPWCDLAAPGGDAKKGNQVLSTLPGNRYGKMQGSSMACPHVSGVAALVLARFKSTGYTPAALRKRLEDNVTDIAAQNANYYLGKGLVNAYKAIAGAGGKAPEMPTGLKASTQSNNVNLSVRVPKDADDGTPTSIYVYFSTSDFTSPKNAMFGMYYTENLGVGDELTGKITGLEFNTKYYLAAMACDLAGNVSALSGRITVTTGGNNPPVLETRSETRFSLKPQESAVASFAFSDPDGHFCEVKLEPGSEAAVLDTLVREEPKVRITAADAPAGTYQAKLIVTDYYGESVEKSIDYTILENHKPKAAKPLEDKIFASKAPVSTELSAGDFFSDEDGEELAYTFSISNPSVVNMTYSGGKFFLTPLNYGISDVTVTGTDIRGETVSQTFKVLVREGSGEVELYPNPVRTNFNIRTGEDRQVEVRVIAASGAVFFEGTLNVSPFSPASVDMTGAAAGAYTVVLTINGKEIKHHIVKI